jgi:hypothetical protein
MDKRQIKRHKRQVSRAQKQVKLSEPDLRTPDQVKAAREASGRPGRPTANSHAPHPAPAVRNQAGPAKHTNAKAEGS